MKSYFAALLTGILLFTSVHLNAEIQPPITIGLAVCLSGPCAEDGQSAVNAAQLAAKDINEKGGILGRKLEFAVEDTRDAITGARAVTAYYALRNNKKVKLFVGPSWTPGLLALAPVVSRDKEAMMISISGGVKEFHEAGTNLFNVRGIDEAGTRELARYAYHSGARTAAVFGSQQAWELLQGDYFEDEFKKQGGEVLVNLEPIPTLNDLNAEMLKIVSKKPDVVLFGAYTQLDKALKALQALNYQGKKVVAFIDESRIKLSGAAIEGAVTLDFLKLSPEFTARLKREFPLSAAAWSGHTGYDALMLYKNAIEKAESFEAADIAKVLINESLEGVSGHFSFDGGRLAQRSTKDSLKVVKDGKLITLPN